MLTCPRLMMSTTSTRRVLLVLCGLSSGCNCGGTFNYCRLDADCAAGQVCSGGTCLAGSHPPGTHKDGGTSGGVAGGGGGGGGGGGAPTGPQLLPDGGISCFNLQCQVQSCPGV